MTRSRLLALCLGGLAFAACSDDSGVGAAPPVAGVRFVNAVADTGALDFRVVDIVGDAPQFLDNTFRTATPYQAVEAGARHLRVFLKPTTSDTLAGSPIVWDTTFTFAEGVNYTVTMTGYARTGSTPPLQMIITTDDAPDPGAQVALRVFNAGAGLPAIDAYTASGAAAPPGSALASPAFGQASAYVAMATGKLSVGVTGVGTINPFVTLTLGPAGVAGTPSLNPIAGLGVSGSALTAVLVPASVVGSAAPQGGRPSSRTMQIVTRSNDTVTVRTGTISTLKNRSPSAADSVVGTTGAAPGVVTGDVILASGATEPEYNGWHVVLRVGPDSISCNPADAGDTPTACAATTQNVIETRHQRFQYRILTAPPSPATGTPVFRIYTTTTADFTLPYVLFLADRRPAMTVP